ncbi:unnamed protein product [Macrosiphum euphorbiae]|uniref:SH2 domain-containing protein n=1 Tax=Macrosiphum euphorbiae TaxID=13131 RepID=A0AAV0XF18_9HEMI|nr:unnamed protein product [Macrosiphum euphorbiae]
MGCFFSCLKSNSRSNVGKKHRPVPTAVPDLVPLPNFSNEGDYNNYIKFEPYYFGNITRYEAEELLILPETLNGAFLIRDTFNTSHKYSLSG